MIHFTPLKLKIPISTPKTSVMTVSIVAIGRIGLHIARYPPNPDIAVCASVGNPVEFGSIPISHESIEYAIKINAFGIIAVYLDHAI